MWSAKGIDPILGPEEITKYDKQLEGLEEADTINTPTAKELTRVKQHHDAHWLYDKHNLHIHHLLSADSWL